MKIAVIGTGNIGLNHIKTICSIKDAEPIAVPIRSNKVAQFRNDGILSTPTLEDAIAIGAEGAIIATDNKRHKSDAINALKNNLDILVEKPLGLNAIQAHEIYKHGVQHKRQVYVGCVLRFSESLLAFKKNLNLVGDIHSVNVQSKSYLPNWRPSRPYQNSYSARKEEGGVLLDLIHEIDYIGWIYGWPTELQAFMLNLNRLHIDSEEIVESIWKSENSYSVSLSLDYLSNPPTRTMHAIGSNGTIKWDGISNTVSLELNGQETKTYAYLQSRDHMFKSEIEAFLKAIKGCRDTSLSNSKDGTRSLGVCDAIRRASQSRRSEIVSYLI